MPGMPLKEEDCYPARKCDAFKSNRNSQNLQAL